MENLQNYFLDIAYSKLAMEFIKVIKQLVLCEIYIVIDGIDECPNRPDLCQKILDMAGGNIKLLVTSRPERDITEVFKNQNRLEITDDFSGPDIAIHIDWMFEHDDKLKTVKLEMKKDFKTHLLSQNKGM